MQQVSTPVLCLLALLLVAAQIQPETVTIDGGVGTSFSQILTITNTEQRPAQYTLGLSEYSVYLADAVEPDTEQFTLQPQESKNIQITGEVPVLGPETHELVYELREDGQTKAQSTLLIPIDGTPNLEARMSVEAQDITSANALAVTAKLANFGNVIAYYQLEMHVREDGQRIGGQQYPRAIQVLPGEEQELTLTYTDVLEPGDYTLALTAQINQEQELEATDPFIVTLTQQSTDIQRGEDLVVTLKRYDAKPRISYVVADSGEILMQETLIADSDELIIPTSTLQTGEYDVQIDITTSERTDTQAFTLTVEEASQQNWPIYMLLIAAILTFILLPATRLRMRTAILSQKITRREKELNELTKRAHELEQKK